MLLILAGISFPSKIHIINGVNEQVILIRWQMFVMSVVSFVRKSKEDVLLVSWKIINILFPGHLSLALRSCLFLGSTVLFNDSVNLDGIIDLLYTLLDVVGLSLLSIEALSLVSLHAASISMHGLDKSHHGGSAVRVETGIVASLGALKLVGTVSNGVLTERWLDIVSEIGDESHAIIKLHSECLIVDSGPSSLNGTLLTSLSSWAVLG